MKRTKIEKAVDKETIDKGKDVIKDYDTTNSIEVIPKNKSLDRLQKELAKDGYIIKRASDIAKEEKIRTGIFGLDYLLSGGISLCEGGHRIELWGGESSGKTTLALYIIKKYQELNKTCAFIDAERSYDKEWGEKLGIDNEKLLIIYPDSLEQLGDILVKIIPIVDLVVIDSIVSLIPTGESERETSEPQMALSARVNALITRKIYNTVGDRKITMIFINQLREKVGVMHGYPNTTGGGHALLHMYNTRIEVKKGKAIEQGTGDTKEKIGIEVNLNCNKNKKGKPFLKTEIDFYLNGHWDNSKSLFYAGLKYGCIQRDGNSYIYKDKKILGQENFFKEFDKWKELEDDIWKEIK